MISTKLKWKVLSGNVMSGHEKDSQFLAHHFHDAVQQRESAKLGTWLFLLTEVLLFGGLFLAYAVFRSWNQDMFQAAHEELDVLLGSINTIVLISSSVTMALAIRSVQLSKNSAAIRYLLVTLAFAATFMVIKYFEYSHKFEVGQLPGKYYFFEGIDGTNPHIFFSLYFMMTGLHGLHVFVGMFLIAWMIVKIKNGGITNEYYNPIENTGLYWHLVDLI